MSTVVKYTKRPTPRQKREVFRNEITGQVRKLAGDFLADTERKIVYISIERTPVNTIDWIRKKNCTLSIGSEPTLYPIALCAVLDVLDSYGVKYIESQGFIAVLKDGVYSTPEDFIKIRGHASAREAQ